MDPNPFTTRGMITKESAFVGRTREMANVLNRIRNSSSVSLVGERRIGKSSMLYHFNLTGNRRLQDESGQQYRFLYMDMHSPKMRTPGDFVAAVLGEWGVAYKETDNVQPMSTLEDALKEWQRQKGAKPILLMDEFEEITQHKDLFNDNFLEALRSFCNGGLLVIITASRLKLKALTDKGDLTSPFWNIFAVQELREFTVDDHLDEVNDFINHYWKNELILAETERRFLDRYRTKHPLKLQVVNYWLLENRNLQYSDKRLKREIKKEILSYFRSYREKLLNRSRRNLPKLPGAINAVTEWLGRQIDNLTPFDKLLK